MRKIVILFYLLCGIFCFQCCSIDNYDAPNATLTGQLVDEQTNEPLQCQYQNGSRIRLYELYNGVWSTQPNDFYTRQDGSFENKAIFAGKYKVVAEGPFSTSDTINTDITGVKNLDIKVSPYLSLSINSTVSASSISVNTQITKSVNASKIKSLVFLCGKTPYVDKNTFSKKQEVNLNGTLDSEIVTKNYSNVFDGLEGGLTYYIRVGALANNASNFYNYSKIIEVKVP